MSNKGNKQPKSFESDGRSKDSFARIYESMFESKAFMDLTKNQRLLYLYMKKQLYAKRKPQADYPEIEQFKGESLFYFNLAAAEKYGLYSRTNNKQFYKDKDVLIDHGFIECVSNGRCTRSKSIYKFSGNWKLWKPPKRE